MTTNKKIKKLKKARNVDALKETSDEQATLERERERESNFFAIAINPCVSLNACRLYIFNSVALFLLYLTPVPASSDSTYYYYEYKNG